MKVCFLEYEWEVYVEPFLIDWDRTKQGVYILCLTSKGEREVAYVGVTTFFAQRMNSHLGLRLLRLNKPPEHEIEVLFRDFGGANNRHFEKKFIKLIEPPFNHIPNQKHNRKYWRCLRIPAFLEKHNVTKVRYSARINQNKP